jgi:hypothetical protein
MPPVHDPVGDANLGQGVSPRYRECLAAVADTSISGVRLVREPDALMPDVVRQG